MLLRVSNVKKKTKKPKKIGGGPAKRNVRCRGPWPPRSSDGAGPAGRACPVFGSSGISTPDPVSRFGLEWPSTMRATPICTLDLGTSSYHKFSTLRLLRLRHRTYPTSPRQLCEPVGRQKSCQECAQRHLAHSICLCRPVDCVTSFRPATDVAFAKRPLAADRRWVSLRTR